MSTYQQHEAHARAVRQGHQGRTSRGLSVEIARFALDNPIFGDDLAELLADLQRCAAECIGAGCEPRVRPLPGQDGQGVSLAAPAKAVRQVEGTLPYSTVYQSRAYQSACPDNVPPSGKRSAEGGTGAGARLALPDGKHGDNLNYRAGV